jgi:hypothetical protein
MVLIPIGIVTLFLLGLGQMLYHLILAYESVKHPPFGREGAQGFSPVFPVPVVPAAGATPEPSSPPSTDA